MIDDDSRMPMSSSLRRWSLHAAWFSKQNQDQVGYRSRFVGVVVGAEIVAMSPVSSVLVVAVVGVVVGAKIVAMSSVSSVLVVAEGAPQRRLDTRTSVEKGVGAVVVGDGVGKGVGAVVVVAEGAPQRCLDTRTRVVEQDVVVVVVVVVVVHPRRQELYGKIVSQVAFAFRRI